MKVTAGVVVLASLVCVGPFTAVAHADDTMTPAAFCAEVHRRAQTLLDSCENTPSVSSLRKFVELSLTNDSCERYLTDVEISATGAQACLAESKSHWAANIALLDEKPTCRAAVHGKLPIGARCFFNMQCGEGSWCVTPPGHADALDKACSPVIKAGTACVNGAGESCGSRFYCDHGKCAPRPTKGKTCDAATQVCAEGLTCLRARGSDQQGKCAPRRKAGEACHRWTECRGACVTPSEDVEDGTCASFCGSH